MSPMLTFKCRVCGTVFDHLKARKSDLVHCIDCCAPIDEKKDRIYKPHGVSSTWEVK